MILSIYIRNSRQCNAERAKNIFTCDMGNSAYKSIDS